MSKIYLIFFIISFTAAISLFVVSLYNKYFTYKNKYKSGNKTKTLLLGLSFVIVSVLLNVVYALIMTILLFYFVWLVNTNKKQKYIKNIDKQIIESIRIFRNAVLSGESVLQAVNTVSQQIKEPLSKEFKQIYDKVYLGISLDEALCESSINIPNERYKLFIDSIRISNTTGAALSEILIKIERSITQRLSIYSKVEALASHGKMSGNIVSVIPFFIILLVYFAEPEMVGILFTSLFGNIILLVSVIMIIAGSFIMRKIAEIQF